MCTEHVENIGSWALNEYKTRKRSFPLFANIFLLLSKFILFAYKQSCNQYIKIMYDDDVDEWWRRSWNNILRDENHAS